MVNIIPPSYLYTHIMQFNWLKEKFYTSIKSCTQGPVVQSVVSLTSSLVVKMLTALVCIISNSQVFLLKKFE